MLRTLGILLTLTALAMGQAMVQHAAAAAGGAAAAAGSKTVASGLEKMLGQAATTTSAAAAAPAPARAAAPNPVVVKHGKPSPFAAKVNRDGGSELAPVLPPLGHGRADDDGETAVIPASGEAARGTRS